MRKFIYSLAALFLLAFSVRSQTYSIDTFTIAGGSGTVSGGAYSISGTVGQPDGNLELSAGGFSMGGGFWSIVDAEPPAVMPTTIFDNTGAGYNGFEAATTNNWLATKICLGAQSYSLVSVTLPLASGDNGGAQVRTVQLQIYSNDPLTGKPSTSTGVIMNLSGATNPITLGVGYTETPFTWMPATPLTLAANTCYWVVLSTGIGSAGQIDVASAATGDAATFGRTASPDAGLTWQPPDNSTSRKMLIQGTAPPTPPELRITTTESIGQDLRLSFTTVAGTNYVIQNSADLSSSAWTTLPGVPTPGVGGTVVVTLTNALGQPQQFYRVKIVP